MELLRALLDRASVNLLYLTATFLKKLSVSNVEMLWLFYTGFVVFCPHLQPSILLQTYTPVCTLQL